MHAHLAAISDFPMMALLFLLKNSAAIAAGVWGAGFALLVVRSMMRWYREDAADARLMHPNGSEDVVWKAMHDVKLAKRPLRSKEIFVRNLFWLPILLFRAGQGLARMLFYPVLVVLDKAKTEAIQGAMKGKVGSSPVESQIGRQAPGVVLSGAIECTLCRETVPVEAAHRCKSVEIRCKRCSGRIKADSVHTCGEVLDEPRGGADHLDCDDCGVCLKPDTVHSCDGKSDNTLYCSACEEKYDPDDEAHGIISCDDCDRRHCEAASCG